MVGFFRNLCEKRQAKAPARTVDRGVQAGRARAARAAWQPSQTMITQLHHQPAVGQLLRTGLPGTATLTAIRRTDLRIDFEPVRELDLLVAVADRPPYPVTLRTVVPVAGLGQLEPGNVLTVRADRAVPELVAVAWGEAPPQ